jgi:hypothetical protein
MTATGLLDELHTRGVHLTVEGEYVAVDAPKGVLTDELRQAIRTQKVALLALLAASPPEALAPPQPLSPRFPCVACGKTARWNDHGLWRCVHCWPAALTPGAHWAKAACQARREASEHQTRPLESPARRRDPRLGPILPPCALCGELRRWHDPQTGDWPCWTCTPPATRRAYATEAHV